MVSVDLLHLLNLSDFNDNGIIDIGDLSTMYHNIQGTDGYINPSEPDPEQVSSFNLVPLTEILDVDPASLALTHQIGQSQVVNSDLFVISSAHKRCIDVSSSNNGTSFRTVAVPGGAVTASPDRAYYKLALENECIIKWDFDANSDYLEVGLVDIDPLQLDGWTDYTSSLHKVFCASGNHNNEIVGWQCHSVLEERMYYEKEEGCERKPDLLPNFKSSNKGSRQLEISIDSFGNRYATLTNLDTNNSWIWTNRDGTPRNIEYSGKWYLYISIGSKTNTISNLEIIK
tara:strand:+ start:2329 stop:3186 length:858 start_codon:yes stop_codon:yes gene_type:complete